MSLLSDCERLSVEVIDRTMELSKIPAPPGEEVERAHLVAQWWRADGIDAVRTDPTGNVWGCLRRGDPGEPAVVVAAHLDTVFDRDVAHGLVTLPDGRLSGPGCGDDTVAVASLAALRDLIPESAGAPVWIVATVGEEGLGDLRGIKAALAQREISIGTVIALEGNYLGRVNVVGVGSERRRVIVTGPGGHAWEESSAPNAVHIAAGMVTKLSELALSADPKVTLNVGVIRGGESINSRAITCTFDLDLRSEDPAALANLTGAAEALLATAEDGVAVQVEHLGSRPAGRIAADHPLVTAACRALVEVEIASRLTAASTDANAAYAVQLPAVTLGITYGEGTHTETEWIDPASVPLGLHALARTVADATVLTSSRKETPC
jgi:acetylornithine deacetylase/succinyl-diaminopimelate desuccinylase-like protein